MVQESFERSRASFAAEIKTLTLHIHRRRISVRGVLSQDGKSEYMKHVYGCLVNFYVKKPLFKTFEQLSSDHTDASE